MVHLFERTANLEYECLVDEAAIRVAYHCLGMDHQDQVIWGVQMAVMQHWRQETDLRVEAVEVMTHSGELRTPDLQSRIDNIVDLLGTGVHL